MRKRVNSIWSAEKQAELERSALEGLSASLIAERIGVTKDAVTSRCRRYGITLKSEIRSYHGRPHLANGLRFIKKDDLKTMRARRVTALLPVLSEKQLETFEAKFLPEPNSGCWLWHGSTTGRGYGGVRIDGKYYQAHRVSYFIRNGKIPDGLVLDHLCRVRCCVNPDHLEPVTDKVNLGRSPFFYSKHCPHGHLFDEENTYIRKSGRRDCRGCQRLSSRRFSARKKAARIAAKHGAYHAEVAA